MQGKRLIIPHHPQRHRLRAMAMIGFATLAILIVGAVQGMMTLSKVQLAKAHDDFTDVAASVDAVQEQTSLQTTTIKDVSKFVGELRDALAAQQAAPTDSQEATLPPAGAVAGAETEVPAE